jgi:hypothetical protein
MSTTLKSARSRQEDTNINLDNTPHPSFKYCADKVNAKYIQGRPGPEAVPSRYALRVGEIDVLVISDGVISVPAAMLAITPTRPFGRPGWTTCSCRRTCWSGR